MPQPTPDQVQIANEVLAGTRQINSSSPAEDTEAKASEDVTRQGAIDASIEQQQSVAMDAYYGGGSPGADAAPIEPAPAPEPTPDVAPEPR